MEDREGERGVGRENNWPPRLAEGGKGRDRKAER